MVGTFRTVSHVTKNQYVRFVFIGGGEQITKRVQGDENVNSSSERNSYWFFVVVSRTLCVCNFIRINRSDRIAKQQDIYYSNTKSLEDKWKVNE